MNINRLFDNKTRIVPIVLVLSFFSCSSPEVTKKELSQHVNFLSSDSLKGRMTGEPGDSIAAAYIKEELASNGLEPVSGDGFQRYRVAKKVVPGKNNVLTADGIIFTPEKDFTPAGFTSNSSHESEIVFAGYGFNLNNDSLKWDDYKDLDVKGKWLMILRADPEVDSLRSRYLAFSGDRDKALLAKDMGAAGVLLVSGYAFDPKDEFEPLNFQDHSVGIPVIRIKREMADKMLEKSKNSIAALEKNLNETRQPHCFPTGIILNGTSEIIREDDNTRNVVMLLPGEEDDLKEEYVIIGAHFDHIGMGGPGSSSRAVDTVGAHHGADDNASGVSLMLELAEKFAMNEGSHPRSILFIGFSGEEMGLLGSKYFTENPGIDLSKVNAMINLDMVGRLQETGVLQISGAGTSEEFKNLIATRLDTTAIKLNITDEGYGPSDHSSFYGKNIPVLFFTTGPHLDYHTPGDTYDKINFEGMITISDLVYKITSDLVSVPEKLKFRESGPKVEPGRVMRRKGVTLGIMPDFAGNVKNGLRADFVTPGKPAGLGGMIKGDIITAINGKSVNNIQDYMFRMGQLKHGQTINVEVLRDEKKLILLIQL